MKTREFLLSASALALAALLAATDVYAQLSCTSKTTSEGAGSFAVTVNAVTSNGRTRYTYTVQGSLNPNKLFVFVKQGLGTNLVALVDGAPGSATYVTPHQFSSSFPPADAWKVVHHQDGVVFPSIAVGHTFAVDVPDRYKPEEGLTTILLGVKSTYEHCGPILGPTTPEAPSFGGQFAASATNLCFKNGCCYTASTDPTTGQVTNLVADPATPVETAGCGGIDQPACQSCFADTTASCSADLSIPDCGKVVITAPLQSATGGICYYPENIKFRC